MLCNLQIFSGCVCHLEQLHAQSPFLFPIVFSINLIPFFDICAVELLAVFQPGCSGVCYVHVLLYVLLYLGRCAVVTVAVCCFGSWSLVFYWGMPRQISPLPPTPSQTEVCSTITMGESIHEKAYIQVRPSSFHNPTLSANKHVVQICRSSLSVAADGLADGSGERRTSPVNGIELKIAQSCRKVVPKSPLPRFQQRCLSTTSRRDACERISAIQAVLKGRTMAIRKGNKHQLGLFFLLEACQRNAAG